MHHKNHKTGKQSFIHLFAGLLYFALFIVFFVFSL